MGQSRCIIARAASFASIGIAALLVVLPLLIADLADAREVSVPLHVDDDSLRRLLLAQVYTDPDHTAAVWRDDSGCNHLTLSDPAVDSREGLLRVVSAGEARAATSLGGHCLLAIDWSGFVETLLEPNVIPGVPAVHFRVVDSTVHGRELGKRTLTGTLWGWVKTYVHPRLEMLQVDLGGPVAELRALLPTVLSSADRARTDAIVASLALTDARVRAGGLDVTLRFDVPEVAATEVARAAGAETGTSTGGEPALGDEELARLDAVLRSWDAFLTFVVKHAGSDTEDRETREALLDVLLDARHELLATLATAVPAGADPVRALFVSTWGRLRPVLSRLQTGLPGEATLRYLGFIAAGDALRAVDAIGPAAGLEISADGLRRLARILAPAATEDPLAYDVAIDPDLRMLFGFGPPLEAPDDNPDVDLSRWLRGVAWAATPLDGGLVARLNRWVPALEEIESYLPLVRDLLHGITDRAIDGGAVDRQWQDVYRALVLATAWQESCWRQFVRVGATIKPIRSRIGAVGLMQVNQRVWRGFYDLKGLARDIAYNGRAGAEILGRYLVEYALARGEHLSTGDPDNLARSTYAVYNGGPAQLRRYRDRTTPARARTLDDLFLEKYRTVKRGEELGVLACYRTAD